VHYILDTANVDSIKEAIESYPISGVTTNPTIIAKENTDFKKLLTDIKNCIGPDRMLHVQVTSPNAEEMFQEAVALNSFVGENFYVKVPTNAEGLKAMMKIHEAGIKITATAIFTQQQALVAARAGADFVAPYVSRVDNLTRDGVQLVTDIVQMFKLYDIKTKVLAASFKTAEQVHKLALAGCDSVTLNPELLHTLLYNPITNYAVNAFNADWYHVYGDKKILDLLK